MKASSVLMRVLSKRSAVAWRMRHMLTWHGVKPPRRIWNWRVAFAQAIHAKYPGKLLAYNCSPSFNWQKNLDDKTIASFQQQLSDMGYKFQFITLAGIHSMWFNMFDLANAYAQGEGMKHYVEKVQQPEFAAAKDGYTFVSHQQEVGTGYFDKVTTIIQGGTSSVTALTGSTEESQF